MKQKIFNKFLSEVDNFNSRQIRQLQEKLAQRKAAERTAALLETPKDHLQCPYCGGIQIWRWGVRDSLQRYRCKSCMKTFNSLTKTPLAKLNHKDAWETFSHCLQQGFSVRKSAKICGIHKNTAFHWRHRFLSLSASIKSSELQGIIEAKETYFRKSEKGNKKLKRLPRKRGGTKLLVPKAELVCLFVARDRHRNTFDTLLNNFSTKSILETQKIFSKDALFCSERKWIYRNFTKVNHLRHGTLDLVCLKKLEEYKFRTKNEIFMVSK